MKRIYGITLVMAILLLAAVSAQAAPELSASSITVVNNEPWLLYGTGLDEPGLEVALESFKPGDKWDAAASLKRLLDGQVKLPAAPSATAGRAGLYKADSFTAAVKPWAGQAGARAAVVWARGKDGVSAPLAVNKPEVWTVTPWNPMAGERIRLFGPNIGGHIYLVSEKNEIRKLAWYQGYSHEKAFSSHYERTADIPADAAPGSWRLYVNGGGGDYGWSEPLTIEIRKRVAAPSTLIDAVKGGARGNGSASDLKFLQGAVDRLAFQGGGVLYLPAGVYILDGTLIVKEGVTLRGAGPGASVITLDAVRFPLKGEIPEEIYEGYARDWLPHQKHAQPLLWLRSRSAVENLKVDATPGDPGSKEAFIALIDEPGEAISRDVRIENCELINLSSTQRAEGNWRSPVSGLLSAGEVRGLILRQNVIRAEQTYQMLNGPLEGAYIGHNRFEGLPTSNSNVGLKGMRRSVFEYNHILNSGRGVTTGDSRRDHTGIQYNYLGYNTFQNIRGIGNGCEMMLYEGGGGLWWGLPQEVTAVGFKAPGAAWKPSTLGQTFVVVTAGRGMGQMIQVADNTTDGITLSRPWTLAPDGKSQLMVVAGGAVQNVHVENQFKEGVAYNGPFGSAMRNIYAGDEYEKVSGQGFVLWAIHGARQMSLNLVRDVRMHDRGSLQLLASRAAEDKDMVKAFGNEFRTNQVYGRLNYPGNEYGLGSKWWRYPGNTDVGPGSARYPSFGHEAGIHLSDYIGWPGRASDDDAQLEKLPAASRWNLIYDSLVARSPVGVRVGRGMENTVIIDLFSALNETPVSDSGRGTALVNPTIKEE